MRWDPSFPRKSPLFWPIAPAAAALASFEDWPTPADLEALFAAKQPPGVPRIRFERAAPKPRRAKAPADARYDARIALEHVVSTRPRSWHDLLNALVWATFPRAKLALHTRQHTMIAARLGEDLRLPGSRTKEQDAVAMLDEGGVVVLESERASCAVIFGHAIYEGLACDGPPGVRGAGYTVRCDAMPAAPGARVALADEALAKLFTREAPIGREDFAGIVVGEEMAKKVEVER